MEAVGIPVGTRVKLRPRAGGDVWDLALAGRTAVVDVVERDMEGRVLLFAVPSLEPKFQLSTHFPVQCGALSPSGSQLALGGTGLAGLAMIGTAHDDLEPGGGSNAARGCNRRGASLAPGAFAVEGRH